MLPSWTRSMRSTPRPWYGRATATTSRRLPSTKACLAASPSATARRSRRRVDGLMSGSRSRRAAWAPARTSLGQPPLVVRRQQTMTSDLVEVDLGEVRCAARSGHGVRFYARHRRPDCGQRSRLRRVRLCSEAEGSPGDHVADHGGHERRSSPRAGRRSRRGSGLRGCGLVRAMAITLAHWRGWAMIGADILVNCSRRRYASAVRRLRHRHRRRGARPPRFWC